MSEGRRIATLIVDDEADLRLLVRLAIEAHNRGLFVSAEVASGREALAVLATADPTVIVLDQRMPDLDGVQTAIRILEARPDQPIVLFSAFLDDQLEATAKAVGVRACLLKNRIRELPQLLMDVART